MGDQRYVTVTLSPQLTPMRCRCSDSDLVASSAYLSRIKRLRLRAATSITERDKTVLRVDCKRG